MDLADAGTGCGGGRGGGEVQCGLHWDLRLPGTGLAWKSLKASRSDSRRFFLSMQWTLNPRILADTSHGPEFPFTHPLALASSNSHVQSRT